LILWSPSSNAATIGSRCSMTGDGTTRVAIQSEQRRHDRLALLHRGLHASDPVGCK